MTPPAPAAVTTGPVVVSAARSMHAKKKTFQARLLRWIREHREYVQLGLLAAATYATWAYLAPAPLQTPPSAAPDAISAMGPFLPGTGPAYPVYVEKPSVLLRFLSFL